MKTLSKAEREAVQYYSGAMHSTLNEYLRGTIQELSPFQEKILKNLQNSFDKLALEQDTQLYRGVRNIAAMGITDKSRYGDKVVMDGFVSTSSSPKQRFRGVELKINAPRGTPAVCMGNEKLSFDPQHVEVLLNDKTKATINKIVRDKTGSIIFVELDVII